jgi:hypothetical protein
MQNKKPFKTYPFTKDQLLCFSNELKRAGGDFDALMLGKKALELKGNSLEIVIYKDIEDYKLKFLTGIYESFRMHYDTEAPFIFWGQLFEAYIESKKNI